MLLRLFGFYGGGLDFTPKPATAFGKPRKAARSVLLLARRARVRRGIPVASDSTGVAGFGHRFPLMGFVGGMMLAVVVLYVPFLQVRFARRNSFRALLAGACGASGVSAPLAFCFALWVHLLFAIPLYILKIEVIPRDLVFLEGLMFLLFIFPARLLGGVGE